MPGRKKSKQKTPERRGLDRKDFSYYMRLVDHETEEVIGHLVDISPNGFKLDSQKPLPLNIDFNFRMDLTGEVATKPYMSFKARSKWCQTDPLDPFVYNVGFQLIEITPEDTAIFNRMAEKYGTQPRKKITDLRRSNLW